ncbi:MAG: GH36-type glycosyl hydrolase domain-containing protein, partial [bacterium]
MAKPVRRYAATFKADRAEFRRRDGGIETVTEICVSPEDDAEIRRITLTNHSSQRRRLELTSYAELVLAAHAADRAHPAFLKMFVETEALPEQATLLAWRRLRSAADTPVWAAHVVTAALPSEPFEFETDRERFLGRGHDSRNPAALTMRLSQTTGRVLDPIFSARRRVTLEPGQSAEVSFVTIAGDSREKVLAVAEKYRGPRAAERAIEMAWTQTQLEFRYLGVHLEDSQRFQELASHVIYPNSQLRPPPDRLRRNVLGQPRLWAHGISGDVPIVTVRVGDLNDKDLVREMMLAHRYWRARGLKVDLVILNEEGIGYDQPLKGDLVKLIQAFSFHAGTDQPGGVFLRSVGQMPQEDVDLILAASCVVLVAARGPLAQQLITPAERLEAPERLRTQKSLAPFPQIPLPYMELPYFNGRGGFTESGHEYVVYLAPDTRTPAPWVNVLVNSGFGAVISESGSGFAWAGNSQTNRLIPWWNDPVTDPCSDAIYLRDEESGAYWTPTPQPVRDSDAYRARHGNGYTIFEHSSHGIDQELVVFVPMDDGGGAPVKVERLKLRNISPKRRRLSVTSYVEWTLGADREETQIHVFASWHPESGALLARNAFHPDATGTAFSALHPLPDSYTSDRTEFLGRNGSPSQPAALSRRHLSGRAQAGFDPCAALQTVIELNPGETVEVVHLVGECASAQEAGRLIKLYGDPIKATHALARTKAWWNRFLESVQVETPELSVNFLLNRWLPYQTLACRVWGRSALYQSGGAFGFRDQLQDVLALLHAAPEIAREHILRAASRQFPEGDVQHWWHPSGAGVRTRCSDDLLWLPYAVARYVRATGDAAILDAKLPFLTGRALEAEETEAYFVPQVSTEEASLFEHCHRAIARGTTAGPHGLPLMGSGDWNDGMNRVGAGGKGESVWLAWFLIDVLGAFAELCDLKGARSLAEDCRARATEIAENVEAHAWDGEWYLRAFFDDGRPLGSRESLEAQIDSLPQSWAVISGAASPERTEAAMRSVQACLLRESEKLALLFTPPFDKSPLDPGYIKGYPPGVRENGGQYTHAAVWIAMAMARLGDGNRAVGLLRWLNPIERTRT